MNQEIVKMSAEAKDIRSHSYVLKCSDRTNMNEGSDGKQKSQKACAWSLRIVEEFLSWSCCACLVVVAVALSQRLVHCRDKCGRLRQCTIQDQSRNHQRQLWPGLFVAHGRMHADLPSTAAAETPILLWREPWVATDKLRFKNLRKCFAGVVSPCMPISSQKPERNVTPNDNLQLSKAPAARAGTKQIDQNCRFL